MKNLFTFLLLSISAYSVISQDDLPSNEIELEKGEADRILACTEIVSNLFRQDQKVIEDLAQQLRTNEKEKVGNKVTGDMLTKCYHSIEDSAVATIFKDGSFQEPEFTDEIFNYARLDYSAMKSDTPDLELSPETQILFMKLEKAKNDYMVSMKKKQESAKNTVSLFGYDINAMPVGVNIALVLFFFAIMGGFVFFLLKGLMKPERESNKSKKKKKKND